MTFLSTFFFFLRMLALSWSIIFKIRSTFKHFNMVKPEIFQNIVFDIKFQSI